MARRPGREDDNSLFSSEQNLERQAELMERFADRVTNHIQSGLDSVMDRVDQRMNQEVTGIQRQLANQQRQQRENQQEYMGIRDRLLTNIANQTGHGQAFDTDWRSVGATIATELVNGLIGAFNVYITRPFKEGFSEMASAYEANFTEIAGRMGTDRRATYNEMRSAVSQLASSQYSAAINANKELIPELRKVSESGFKGQEAISIALDNSIDNKLLPWLDTHSEAWVNLQYNLSQQQLQTYRGQQLLLQETRTGNRMLQSGVVNKITTDLAPAMLRIDYGVNKDSLTEQAEKIIGALTDQGYEPDQAYGIYNKLLEYQKNPFNGFNEGTAFSVLAAEQAYLGGGLTAEAGAVAPLYGMAADAGRDSSAIVNSLGLPVIDGWSGSEFTKDINEALSNAMNYDLYEGNTSDALTTFQEASSNLAEKVTKTQAYDNKFQNEVTDKLYWINNSIAHGADIASQIATTTSHILQAIIGMGIGNIATNLLGRGAQSVGGSIGRSLASTAGGKMVGGAARGLARGASLLPGVSTSAQATESMAAASGLEMGGIGSLGLSGALSSVGSSMGLSGTAATVGGTAAVAAPLLVGAGGLAYGIHEGVDDFQNGHNVRGTANVAGGVAMGVGGAAVAGGMLAAGAANAWNPVGWGLLIAGAVTLAATTIHKAVTPVSGMAEAMANQGEEIKKQFQEQQDEQIEYLGLAREAVKQAKSEQELRNIAVESGLLPQLEAEKLLTGNFEESQKALTNLVTASQQAEAGLKGLADAAVDSATDKAKKVAKKEDERIRKEMNSKVEGMMKDYGFGKGKMLTEADNPEQFSLVQSAFEQMAKSIENEEEKKKALEMVNTIFKDGELQDEELDNLTDISSFEGNAKALFHTTIDRKRTAFRSSRDLNAASNAAEMLGVTGYTDALSTQIVGQEAAPYSAELSQAFRSWTAANDEITKAAAKQKFISTWEKVKANEEWADYLRPIHEEQAKSLGIEKFAVGSPYINTDKFAMVHKGEAIVTAQENKSNLLSLLGIKTDQIEIQKTTSQDIIKAIQSQTEVLKAVLESLGGSLSKSSKFSGLFTINNTNNDNVALTPSIANTRLQ